MRKPENKGLSAGTIAALILTVLVLAGSAWVLGRLGSGAKVDLTALAMAPLNLTDDGNQESGEEILITAPGSGQQSGTSSGGQSGASSGNAAEADPTEAPAPDAAELVFAGTAAIEENVRKSCYAADTQKYDFAEVMTLLAPEIRGDLNAVFLENRLSDSEKVSSAAVPQSAAEMLRAGGFDTVACGFSRAYDKGMDGVRSTLAAVSGLGMTPLGLQENEGNGNLLTRRIHGITVTVLQYTGTVSANTRKSMVKKGESFAVPEAEAIRIAADIADARKQGAEFIAVMLNWGKVGRKAPDKNQRTLAQAIANAGADVIIGAGSRIAQTAEWLETPRGRILAVWSLGTLVSDERAGNRVASYLLRITVGRGPDGQAAVTGARYTPVYIWKYRQDSKNYYRCLAANRTAPDGMDSEQMKNLEKAMTTISGLLEGSPLSEE